MIHKASESEGQPKIKNNNMPISNQMTKICITLSLKKLFRIAYIIIMQMVQSSIVPTPWF